MDARCRIVMLGGLRVRQGEREISRFRAQKYGALLAYLAYHLGQQHAREVLVELFWLDGSPEAQRNNLSQALSSLRHQLEPPGVPAGAVIVADRASVRLNPEVVTTDVAEFEAALDAAAQVRSRTEREQCLDRAVGVYRGPLLPGHYEEWIPSERERLAERYLQALGQLATQAKQANDLRRALDYARRALGADPLREELHQELMRLYAALEQPSAALRQYRELERIFREELGDTPSAASRQLARAIEAGQETARSPSDAGTRGTEPQGEARSDQEMRLPSPADRAPVSQVSGERPATSSPPLGTVTFLLTDIERPLALPEVVEEAYGSAVTECHALLRRELRRHGGYEVQELGDSFIVAFERAGDALTCAVANQRALAAHRWLEGVGAPAVRMVLHTGDVELTDGQYRGAVLHHAARMLAAAHGGQILCSEVTAGVLRRGGIAAVDADVRLTDLGVYGLPDVPGPERLFQVDHPAQVQREFPPPRAQAGHAGSLPLQLTRFFGREKELAQLRELLLDPQSRLVTLTGPGGSGKTRLAVEAAGQLLAALNGAVWFVPLADLLDPGLILETVRDALRLPRSPHLTPLEQVTDALSSQPSLLVLDNFEQLVEQGAAMVRDLVERVSTLQCLVTSRQRLELTGEREFVVLPLPVPTRAVDPERLTLYESVQLFVDRAQAVRPDFQVTNSNAPAVAALCERLEGIPLALELAAARAQVLTPQQMLAQLAGTHEVGGRFDFLVSRRRDAPARHRTLRAAIEWGYQLLAPELQRFFARLSVFRGGWTLEAAEVVTEEPLALDYLAQLRECSLVLVEETSTGMRFRMLEMLREFARDQLEAAERDRLSRWSAIHLVGLAEQIAERRRGEWTRGWRDWLDSEHDNLRGALEWALESEPELALRLAGALGAFWSGCGYIAEGREMLRKALQQASDAPPEVRAKALEWAATLAYEHGEVLPAREMWEEMLSLSRAGGDRPMTALALLNVAHLSPKEDEAGKRALREEALQIGRETGDLQMVSGALEDMGSEHWEECLAIQRQLGRPARVANLQTRLAVLATRRGEYAEARARLEEAIGIRKQRGQSELLRWPLFCLARVARLQGNTVEARSLLLESLKISRQLGDRWMIARCLEELAVIASALEQGERATRLLGAADTFYEAFHFQREPVQQAEYDAHIRSLREALGEAVFAAAWKSGQKLSWQQAADYGLEG